MRGCDNQCELVPLLLLQDTLDELQVDLLRNGETSMKEALEHIDQSLELAEESAFVRECGWFGDVDVTVENNEETWECPRCYGIHTRRVTPIAKGE